MDDVNSEVDWWCEVSIRICHAGLDPTEISGLLKAVPQSAQRPGESRIPHGDCRSAGYWCLDHRIDAPDRPNAAIMWGENFVKSREAQIRNLMERGYDVNVFLGVFSNVLALGFDLPSTPTIWKLRVPIGIEFYAR